MPSKRFSLNRLGQVVLVLGLTFAAPATAQVGGDAGQEGFLLPELDNPIETRQAPQGPGLVDVTLKLAFVIGLIYLLSLAWKRYGRPGGAAAGDEVIRLWATKSLGIGSDMYLVEIGDRMLLVGKSGTGMATLTEFDDPGIIDELKATCVVPMAVPAGNWLDRLSRREGGR